MRYSASDKLEIIRLVAHLRATRAIRRSRHASLKRDGLGQIKDVISIRERPATVEDRAIPGHWEGDLISAGFLCAQAITNGRSEASN